MDFPLLVQAACLRARGTREQVTYQEEPQRERRTAPRTTASSLDAAAFNEDARPSASLPPLPKALQLGL